MEDDAVEKNVYFYKTFANPSFNPSFNPIQGQADPDNLYHMFDIVFHNGCTSYIFSDEFNIHHLDIKEFDSKHIFGLHSKEETSPNSFVQFRNKLTNATESILSKTEPEKVLEYYTFFYVDFNKLMTAVIYNKQAGSLDKVMKSYFYQQDCILEMIPYSIDNIKDAIKRFKYFSGIEYIYNEKSAKEEFRTLSELKNLDMEIGSYKINLSIKRSGNKLASEMCKLSTDKYSSFKVKGKSEDNMTQCFDFVKKIFLRTAKIDVTNDPQGNLNIIKNTLSSEIIKIFNN